LQIQTYIDPAAFLDQAQPFLEAQETVNNLILGVTIRLRDHPEWTKHPPYLAVVENSAGEVQLAASITPPHNLLLAGSPPIPEEAIELLIQNLCAGKWTFPGTNAEKGLALRFAEAWARAAGVEFRAKMRLRAYELRQVVPPLDPPGGTLRLASPDDLETVAGWRVEFIRESLHEDPPEDNHEDALRFIQAGSTFLWEDQQPVSMAVSTRPTPHGVSIGGVYTPPEYRGRGYASACVAALSQRLLDGGKSFCTLFTDLDYPTSNSIYQKIGYRPVCDFTEYTFFG